MSELESLSVEVQKSSLSPSKKGQQSQLKGIMEFLFIGGVGVCNRIAVKAIKRNWSDGSILSSNNRAAIEESNHSPSNRNLEPRGRYLPCKLPFGYKMEKK